MLEERDESLHIYGLSYLLPSSNQVLADCTIMRTVSKVYERKGIHHVIAKLQFPDIKSIGIEVRNMERKLLA